MKIAILANFPLHVIPDFGSDYFPQGHYATWLPQLANAWADFPDLEIHWITLNRQVGSPREVRWKNQTFHIFPTTTKFRSATLFARDRKAINACLAEIQPQLVHGWGTEDVYALAAVTSGFPNLVSMQGILSHLVLKGRSSLHSLLLALFELYILRKADTITVESAWGRDLILQRKRAAEVHLVEYGVQDRLMDTPWQPDPCKPSALFIGTITPGKGIQDAIAAFGNPSLSNAELWIAGSGDPGYVESLRAASPPHVKWMGRLSPDKIAELLCRAWCLVLPTRADTSPNVVKEARVVGLPVVSTPCGGQTTYIEHGKNGFLVEPRDIGSLTKALCHLLSDWKTCEAAGRHLHEEHRLALHPRRTAENFAVLYRQKIGS